MNADPGQWMNRWGDPGCAERRKDLITLLEEKLPERREPELPRLAPV
jgi:hypothetical protein